MRTCFRFVFCLPALLLLAHAAAPTYVYIGTYTRDQSKGIYVFRWQEAQGTLEPLGVAAEVPSPSFLAIHPNRRYLYAVNELGGNDGGRVTAFRIDPATGKLTQLNQVSSGGSGACHLAVDKTGRTLVAVNYGSGSVASYGIGNDGYLSEPVSTHQHSGKSVDPRRQGGPHAHSVNFARNNKLAVVADLGLDQLKLYQLDAAKHTLTPAAPPEVAVKPGAGPRHFAFHPQRNSAYVINELQSTVTAFDFDPRAGTFKEVQTISTLPAGFAGENTTAEVVVHPTGRFVYGSNRGHDSIAVFAVDQKTGQLTAVEQVPTGGKTPRNFSLDPAGRFLIAANQNTNDLVVFRVDQETGKLTPTGQMLEAPVPVCVRFVKTR